MLLDLENIEDKFEEITRTAVWDKFCGQFFEAKVVFIFGNGGQYPTAMHASSDASRLIEGKNIISMDNMSYLTSVANDYGYETVFEDWLKKQLHPYNQLGAGSKDILVLGLSCSGNSENVLRALELAKMEGYEAALFSGQPSKRLSRAYADITEVCMDVKYFHTAEILSMYLLYEAIAFCDGRCPTIVEEIERKGD